MRLARGPVHCPDLPYACSDDQYVVGHNSPIGGWIKLQWEGEYNNAYDNPTVKLTSYPDGHVTHKSHHGNEITTSEIRWGCGYPDFGDLKFLGIGGFARVPRLNNGNNSFRYFAGVYMDNTHARVMLGDNQNYNTCSIMEPQIPSAWTESSINISANLGNLPDSGVAYLFVFDADNNHNSVGYPVTIRGGGNFPGVGNSLRVVEDN